MSKFKFTRLNVPDMILVEPKIFGDERGYFFESYHKEEFAKGGICAEFVQDNVSKSRGGVLRGLHFQTENCQAKLVRVLKGSVYDVGVDLRPNSPHFGKWAGAVLSEENKNMLYVPEGFAHGFLVLSNEAEFTYKCTDYYNPSAEGGVIYNDEEIGIEWPEIEAEVLLSEKDAVLKGVKEQDFSFFERWYKP